MRHCGTDCAGDISVEVSTTVHRGTEDVELLVRGSFPRSSIQYIAAGHHAIDSMRMDVAIGDVYHDVPNPGTGQIWQDDFTLDEDLSVREALALAVLDVLGSEPQGVL